MDSKPILVIDNCDNDPTVLMAEDCRVVLDYDLDDEGNIKVRRSYLLKELIKEVKCEV